MKKLLLTLLVLFTFVSMIIISVDLYTKDQTNVLVRDISERYRPVKRKYIFEDGKWKLKMKDYLTQKNLYVECYDEIQPIHLSLLLYLNIYTIDTTGNWSAGNDTPMDYKNGWRKMIAKNPTLAYKALDLYGETMVRQLDSRLKYKYIAQMKEGNISQKECWDSFTTQKFWIAQTTLIRRYHKLIDRLLELSERDLNYYIVSNVSSDNAVSYGFQSWLIEENLVIISNQNPEFLNEHSNDCIHYPGDLLLLTKRIYEDYPEWTPRKFLTEAKKFSNKVLEIIEENY
jgi:hypothetical protein